MDLLSRIEFEAEAAAPVFIFVDGYNGEFAGPYTLEIRRVP
jgi:hypothetical protein